MKFRNYICFFFEITENIRLNLTMKSSHWWFKVKLYFRNSNDGLRGNYNSKITEIENKVMVFVKNGRQSKRRCYDLSFHEKSHLDVYTGADDLWNGLPPYSADKYRSVYIA